jgi:hypothetical protein
MVFQRPDNTTTTPAPVILLDEFAKSKIAEVLKRKSLNRTNYQEPDDTCECTDFVTDPPAAPRTPRRKRPITPPRPPRPPILPPPLPPPPVRFDAPQLPNAIPPLIAPPPIIFGRPNIDIDVDVPPVEEEEDTTTPSTSTTESPPSDDGADDFWEGLIPCCLTAPLENVQYVTDTELALAVEESTHSGEFRNGCYPMCDAGSLAQYRLGWENSEFDGLNTRPPAGFCDKNQIQICKCYARNAPYNPCYRGNGQVAKPGASITSTSLLKRILLPRQYASPADYYAEVFSST